MSAIEYASAVTQTCIYRKGEADALPYGDDVIKISVENKGAGWYLVIDQGDKEPIRLDPAEAEMLCNECLAMIERLAGSDETTEDQTA